MIKSSLSDLLPDSLYKSPAVSIRLTDTVGDAATLLSHYLESFTDSLVVTKNEKPVGVIGGIELLDGVLKNPTSDFFDKTSINKIMNEKLTIITNQTILADLLKQWQETRRAFAIISNPFSGYSAISARKMLEIAIMYGGAMAISEIPKKRAVTFNNDYTARDIITSMFENKTRKLILENTSSFISDRIIIEKIVKELNHLHNIKGFLDMKASIFKLENAKAISENSSIQDASKIMYEMLSPYLMANDQVISPWDVVMSLKSEKFVR
ncbi:MAG TPA: CBS domain-containing protein [Nitrosopumilaceae archaeon]|nr:CBS domain-containing protein [Nitrosopumilaceae archaeon]